MPKISWIIDLKSGQSVYEAAKVQRAIEGIGKAAAWSGKNVQQLQSEQNAIARELRGLSPLPGPPSDSVLRSRSQSMLAGMGTLPGNILPPAPINRKMAGMGFAAGMLSPFIGATLLNQSGIMGGGGGGGAIGKLLGAGGLGGFGIAYIGLQLASRALKAAFDELRNSVKKAADLFFESAKLRISPGTLMQSRTVLSALGVDHSDQMMQSMVYNKGKMTPNTMANLVGVSGQPQAARYISGLVADDKKFWDEMARNSKDFHVLWSGFSYQLDRMAATLANDLLPTFNNVLVEINRFGYALTVIAKGLGLVFKSIPGNQAWQIIGGFSGFDKKSNGGAGLAGINWQRQSANSFEKMGFVIGGGADSPTTLLRRANALLERIAANTGGGKQSQGSWGLDMNLQPSP